MTVDPAFGNREVIDMLKYWLGEADKGLIQYGAFAAVQPGHKIAYDYAGANGVENLARRALKTVDAELKATVDQRKLGKRNLDLSASYVEYHLSGTPMCWDFLIWLIAAEMTRVRLGGPPPLRVAFTKGEGLSEESKSFFERVFRPLLPLIGAVEDVNAVGGRHRPIYVPIEIVNWCRGGQKVPIVRASQEARETMKLWLHGTRPITITLREAGHWPNRNSQIKDWLKFAKDLEDQGEDVIFIRDTLKANEALPGFCSAPICAFNVDLRMALYEQAKVNFGVSNGPMGLTLFSEVPYLYFVNQQPEDKGYIGHKGEWWFQSNGIAPGEQWPWARSDQYMIWKRDNYKDLCEVWEQYGHDAELAGMRRVIGDNQGLALNL